ncbi:MAG: ATP-binding protein [Deltaproteobacteria bacterium]|nr:ATP-binding protein [Deltaproteobacteria bacterium]
MLTQPMLDKLSELRLRGMRAGLEEQSLNPQYAELPFEDRLGLLLDRESCLREENRLSRRLRAARLKEQAVIEDLDFSPSRGLPRSLVMELSQSDWVRRHFNVIVVGPTGVGKSYLACALGHSACRSDCSVRYERTSRLLSTLELSRADGSYPKLLDALSRTQLLILDDWLRDPLSPSQTRDMLEILDDRYRRASTLVATQIPVDAWHDRLSDPTLADALLDRLVHNAFRLAIKGESRRKTHLSLTHAGHPGV